MAIPKREAAVYLLIAFGSLLMISYVPHMFLDGLIEDSLKKKITIFLTISWAIGLTILGWDIVRKRSGKKGLFKNS
ncbi:MAG: hypothetical protein OEY38_10260 [Gammaproteobacteria bacterium]|nr:hypothetical protein [Gammaproteobacteria bacterium]